MTHLLGSLRPATTYSWPCRLQRRPARSGRGHEHWPVCAAMSRSTRTTREPCPTSAARPGRSALGLGLDWPLGLAVRQAAEPAWNGERPWRGRLGEADDGTVPGRWEGDVPIGKDCKSAAGTVVERHPVRPAAGSARRAQRLPWPGTGCGRQSPPSPHHHLGARPKKVVYQFW